MQNAKLMMIGALAMSLVALIVAGFGFGQLRSASDRLATMETQVVAVETVQSEQARAGGLVDEVRSDVEILAGQVAELTERVNRLTVQIEADPAAAPDDGPDAGDDAQDAPPAQ
jgi:hypothetical protein